MAIAYRASICSVTRIVPSSAASDEPTRPAIMSEASTGASSRVSESETTDATNPSAWKRSKPRYVCSAITIPVNIEVRPTTGSESTPTRTIWRIHSRASKGRRNVQ